MIFRLLLIFSLYIPFQLALNPYPGIDLASIRIFAVLLAFLWILEGLKRKEIFIPITIQTLLIFSFLFLSSFSILFSENTEWSLRKIVFLFSFFPLYFVVSNFAGDTKKNHSIITYLSLGAVITSAIGIFQFFSQFFLGLDESLALWKKIITPFLGNSFSQSVFSNSSWLVNISGNDYFRSISFFPDPHMSSFYLGMMLPWSIILWIKSSGNKNSNFWLFLSGTIFIADILTFSRGGYAGLLTAFFFASIIFWKKIWKRNSIILVLIIIFFLLLILPINPASKRLYSSFDLSEGSNQGRMETWIKSIEITKNNLITGVGIGNYPLSVKSNASYREPIYSHNAYLDIASETGILNSMTWVMLLTFSIIGFYRKSKEDILYLGGFFGLIIFSIHSIFETAIFSVHVLPILIIFIALSNHEKQR